MKPAIQMVAASLLAALNTIANAADLLVPAQYQTLQLAHDAAADGDRIVIASGIYSSQVVITKSLVFIGPTDGAATCRVGRMIIGGAQSPVVRIERLRFEGNSAPQNDAAGGALRIQAARLSIQGCAFVANGAYDFGGAIFQWSGDTDIANCVFERNQTGAPSFTYNYGGGAIAAGGGRLDIHQCTFIDNSAGPGNGGAINRGGYSGSAGTLRVWACVFCGGTSARGAAAIHGGDSGLGNIFRRCTGGQFVVTGSGNLRSVAIDCNISGAVQCVTNGADSTCDASAPSSCALSLDCDHNGLIDAYEVQAGIATDCNANELIDSCELVAGGTPDCNQNGVPDSCDIAAELVSDRNGNGVPDICELPNCHDADLYRNNRIDGADLGILLSEWGPVTPSTNSDINEDGFVNGADLGLLLSFWGSCP